MTRYLPPLLCFGLAVLLYQKLKSRAIGNKEDHPYFFVYKASAPHTKTGYMTDTNYRKVPLEEYVPTGQGHPIEYGLITLSESTTHDRTIAHPNFSKITFDPQTGFPNGGDDLLENDTK
jgi:hypothetical protein